MTSRQTGQRISAARRRTVRSGAGQRRRNEPLAAKDLRRLAQLVACGSVFVLLVAVKLLLPAKMAVFNEKLTAVMEQNMDVQAVFSAVGRAFSGEEGSGVGEVYQAVFHPQTGTGRETDVPPAEGDSPERGEASRTPEGTSEALPEAGGLTKTAFQTSWSEEALDTLRRFRQKPEASQAPERPGAPEASNLAYVLYSQENLPEGVSMEQVILGFDYCTPVSGALSSDFGYREHPTEGEERFHYGVDLAAEIGTEVECFADGTVTAVGDSSSYGRYCVVAHEGGYSTLYAHCSRITASSGTAVRRGDKIAEVGDTGMATGPHLHFELQREGTYLNPIYYVSTL